MNMLDILKLPTAAGRDGIHISAQLQVDAMQLRAHRIGWAGQTMEQAAAHINAVEDLLSKQATLFECRAWDEESEVLDTIGVFPDIEAAKAAVNKFLEGFGDGWTCRVIPLISPSGPGFLEYGQGVSWEYDSPDEIKFRCQNCAHEGDEVDFMPSDGNPAPYICPKCGSTECFAQE